MTTINLNFQQDWNCDGLPGNVITLGQGGILYKNDRVIDTTTGKRYKCTVVGEFDNVDTYTGCEFVLDVDDSNVLSTLSDKGWKTNTPRSWQTVSSPDFNTPRIPSSTNDVEVLAIVSLSSTAVNAAAVNGRIDSSLVATQAIAAGIVATEVRTLNFTVPPGSQYDLTDIGNASIIQIKELLK